MDHSAAHYNISKEESRSKIKKGEQTCAFEKARHVACRNGEFGSNQRLTIFDTPWAEFAFRYVDSPLCSPDCSHWTAGPSVAACVLPGMRTRSGGNLLHWRVNGASNFVSFILVRDDECVQVAAAADFEFSYRGVVLYLHAARIFSAADGEELL
ncbi:hypothetical protein TRVL_08232 [Trypanosoma vivax]|uniref:Uncharacterized protein n=1 Tax=Trypanosoma vivax (strain Y486) TaxID=1055687 RepID=G0U1S6_TRYVY|nr:hypothetical protein TRVL_08232 [Trypanosoma vivax]CCC50225.1 hypothetical protein, unlikely [Trypanosoma vivax Y486]